MTDKELINPKSKDTSNIPMIYYRLEDAKFESDRFFWTLEIT